MGKKLLKKRPVKPLKNWQTWRRIRFMGFRNFSQIAVMIILGIGFLVVLIDKIIPEIFPKTDAFTAAQAGFLFLSTIIGLAVVLHKYSATLHTHFTFLISVKSDIPRMYIFSSVVSRRAFAYSIDPKSPSTPYIDSIYIRNRKNKSEVIRQIFMTTSNKKFILLKDFQENPLLIDPYRHKIIKLDYVEAYYKTTIHALDRKSRQVLKHLYTYDDDLNKFDVTKIVDFLIDRKNKVVIRTDKGFYISNNKKTNDLDIDDSVDDLEFFTPLNLSEITNSASIHVLSNVYYEIKKDVYEKNCYSSDVTHSLLQYKRNLKFLQHADKFQLQVTQFANGVFRLSLIAWFNEESLTTIMDYEKEKKIYDDFKKSPSYAEYHRLLKEIKNCQIKQKEESCNNLIAQSSNVIMEFLNSRVSPTTTGIRVNFEYPFVKLSKDILEKNKPTGSWSKKARKRLHSNWLYDRFVNKKAVTKKLKEKSDGKE